MDAFSTCSDVSSDTGSIQSPFPAFQPLSTTASNFTVSLADSLMHYASGVPKLPTDPNDYDLMTYSASLSASERDRKQREFIPDSKKDDKYWERRRKNNEAAKRSREKRRQNDILMEHRINVLMAQNTRLRQELIELKLRFGLPVDESDRSPILMDESCYTPDTPSSHSLPVNNSTTKNNHNIATPDDNESFRCEDKVLEPTPPPPAQRRRSSAAQFDESEGHTLVTLSTGTLRTDSSLPHHSGSTELTQHSYTPIANTVESSTRNGDFQISGGLPHLRGLDGTDLLTLKRIFTTLTTRRWNDPDETTGCELARPDSGLSPKSVCSPLANGSSGLNNASAATVSAVSSSDPVAAAWLLQQAMLLSNTNDSSVTHPLKLPELHTHGTRTPGSLERTSALLKLSGVNMHISTPSPLAGTDSSPALPFESPLDLSLCMQAVRAESVSSAGTLSNSNDSRLMDKRYQDRRRRNNEAVRRCRENKRARLMGRVEVTDRLQTENRVLRTELTGLSLEVQALRKMLAGEEQPQQQSRQQSPPRSKAAHHYSVSSIPILSGPHLPTSSDSNEPDLFLMNGTGTLPAVESDRVGLSNGCTGHSERVEKMADDSPRSRPTYDESEPNLSQAEDGKTTTLLEVDTEISTVLPSLELDTDLDTLQSQDESSLLEAFTNEGRHKRINSYHSRLSHLQRGRRRLTKSGSIGHRPHHDTVQLSRVTGTD
ncbi:unnamed protein product [Dicrocoelium dendriticum]|nr:unnamed protein product [Dicrocoelium dendriticum]